jgi:Sec-independent protein translocase protein TatA
MDLGKDAPKMIGVFIFVIVVVSVLILLVGTILPNLISDFGWNAHNATQNMQAVNNSTSNLTQSGSDSSQLGVAVIISALATTAMICLGIWLWKKMHDIPGTLR